MKNISRRVFIKGMAVAAVATAASTVLAGCNLPVNPVEPEVVPGFQPESKVIELDDDKTFTVGTTAFATAKTNYNKTYNDLAVLSVTLDNKTESDVRVGNQLTAVAFFDDRGVNRSAGDYNLENDLHWVVVKANTDTVTSTTKGNLYFEIPESNKDWKTITFVFTLDGEKVEFVVNK